MLVKVAVNGAKHEAEVEPRLLLVHLIRENLRLTGTHIGCDTSHCGACTVLLDGRPVKSCTMFAVQAHGREITTVEGLEQEGKLHRRARATVRLLHPGHAHDQRGVPQEEPSPDRGRYPPGHLRQPLSLHRLRQHRLGHRARGGQAPGRRMMALRTSPEVGGMGHSIKRKEDPRFIRGKGTYVDDVVLPGMLYLDIVRSPFAHAKIKKIDISKATAIPGVLAVITGKDLAKYNLHWMPTLMSDTQMVLPVEKVMYQAQEVAAVLATTRYIAADGVDAVEVDYDPLPVVVDPKKALLPDAPVLRTDKKDKKDNHIWHWEWGNREATTKLFDEAEVTVKE